MKQKQLEDIAKIVVTADQIQHRLKELGEAITRTYREQNIEEITAVCITNGSILFAADLVRHIDLYTRIDCIRVSSYQDDTKPITEPEIIDNIRVQIESSHVLLIDDILDTGRTLSKIVNVLRMQNPTTIRTCVLLDKIGRRQVKENANFIGFHLPDEFVVGYGLDFAERYRNLPCIGVLKPELQNPPVWR